MTRTVPLILAVIFLVLGLGCSPTNIQPIDATAPTISNVLVSDTTDTSAIITWNTNEPADSQVSYGTTETYATSS
ncbi:MAG: hypothetical protein KAI94_05485, partial [Anaerolineales bacterium]|nr:hypothetical protein [Anaerolineales bacterium]